MSGIFKAYDIRGLSPQELDTETARKIGSAFAEYLGGGKIVIGRDMRTTSADLSEAFAEGALSSGMTVFDIRLSTTPMLYSAIIRRVFDGGAMITASHLPKQYNGIKLCRTKAVPLSGKDGLPEIEAETRKMGAITPTGVHAARIDFLGEYVDELSSYIEEGGPLKVVVDAGNGMGGIDTERIIPRYQQTEFITMFMRPDGKFPNHIPNPALEDSTAQLQERVRTEGADLGIAFDGDGDRSGFVDELGNRVPADLVIALIAEYYLQKSPGATILYDLRSSHAVPERIEALGGKPEKTRVGHSFIKQKMRQESALFAGELSGHYYFQDIGYIDSGLMAMIVMLNLLGRQRKPLSELVDPLMKYARSGEINIAIDKPDQLMKYLASTYRDGKQEHLDGLTVEYADWWFNLRQSHTEPVVRLVIEANDESLLDQKSSTILGRIEQQGGEVRDE
ncbi:MAG: phosphomannomutase/phosphoglucomutase [Anaerolineales bacterium]